MSDAGKEREVVVVGGGIAGLRSAIGAADSGAKVTLVEVSPFLGGLLMAEGRIPPEGFPSICLASSLINRVLHHPRIRVLTNSSIKRASKRDGRVKVSLTQRPAANVSWCAP